MISLTSGEGGRDAEGARAPPKVLIWWQAGQYLRKSVKTFANSLKVGGEMAPNVLWFEKNGAQRIQNHMKAFYWRSSQKRSSWESIRTDSCPKIFWAIFGKFGQKSFAPPKICLLLHLRVHKFYNERLRFACDNPYRISYYIPRNVNVRPQQAAYFVSSVGGLIRNSMCASVK